MKSTLKSFVKKSLVSLVHHASKTRGGGYLFEQVINNVMSQVAVVEHRGFKLKFSTPNSLNRFRANTFSTKEPETLEWIEDFLKGTVFWDIGANVGLYSVYAAKARGCYVYAFEPSVFNLELLARNVFLNDLTDCVCLVPLALNDKMTRSKLNMTNTEWGGALSTFCQNFAWDGKPMKKVFAFQTLGLSITEAMNVLNLPQPDYIKMDVDGLEHFILRGGREVIEKVKGVLVEINDDFSEQAIESRMILHEAGLTFKEKRHSQMFDGSSFQNTYNQIWYRA